MRAASLIFVLLAAPAAAGADDYLMVFAADSIPYNPTKAHTFAAVVRVETAGGRPPRVVDVTSLSWLPESMKVRAFALRPERGRNVPLEETIGVWEESGGRVCLWGPYRVTPAFADTFRARVATVEGTFGYKGACLTSRLTVCDCARSVEEMIDPRRRFIGAFGYGAAAASYIVRKFTPHLVGPEQSHPWVATLIGLDAHALVRRPFGDYTTRIDQFGAWFQRE